MSEIEFTDIELKGDAEMSCGAWIGNIGNIGSASGVTVEVIQEKVCIGLDYGLTPDTARSMASALNYYADQADKYKDK